jgi:hypothetical protein
MGQSWGGAPPYVKEYVQEKRRLAKIAANYQSILIAEKVQAIMRRERRKDLDSFARHFGRVD